MTYLSGEEILIIHAQIIDETGGAHGVRDTGLFSSIVHKPKAAFSGKEMYPTVFDKAATYLEALAKFHVFVDGNKRTAVVVASRFLFLSGYDITASNDELEDFALRVVERKLDVPAIAVWLKRHAKKLSTRKGKRN